MSYIKAVFEMMGWRDYLGKHDRRPSLVHSDPGTGKRRWWKFTLRDWDDDEEQDWWFASTAIPLLAATLGPLANVLSIAALVTSWRMCVVKGIEKTQAAACPWNNDPNYLDVELKGQYFADPHWCYYSNVVSLIVGFIGNFFLLCNFTNRIRYIIALPVTIIMWYIATGILIGITVAMELHVPPARPQQTYTQGFWYAVLAACLYLICSMLLMINMLGYFLGHYPQTFTLTEAHRTLILQTMLFFVWLAGGGAMFSAIENKYGSGDLVWGFVNGLYFSDVTILTVGFGDLYPTSNIGRGLVFPYVVGGIIMLGLMVTSLTKFAEDLGSEKIIQKHIENSRVKTAGRTVTSSVELEHRKELHAGERPIISAPFNPVDRSHRRMPTIKIADEKPKGDASDDSPNSKSSQPLARLTRAATNFVAKPRTPKLILLREEKDRFEAMRRIQDDTESFKKWTGLSFSVVAFAILWCVGAVVFWQCEHAGQGMTYFQALYFCYVSLLTVGYGDMAPKSNPGRPFFVVWSLIAVPTMTILVSHLGTTVVEAFKHGVSSAADFTFLPKHGVWRKLIDRYPWLVDWFTKRRERKAAQRRIEEGFPTGPARDSGEEPKTIEQLAKDDPSAHELARRLAHAIKAVAKDARDDPDKRYSYEEWVEHTRLIRFTVRRDDDTTDDEGEGMVDWDWIGENSPMLAKGSEASFVLDRLCESMNRYIRRLSVNPRDVPARKPSPMPSGGLIRRNKGSQDSGLQQDAGSASDMAKSGSDRSMPIRRRPGHDEDEE